MKIKSLVWKKWVEKSGRCFHKIYSFTSPLVSSRVVVRIFSQCILFGLLCFFIEVPQQRFFPVCCLSGFRDGNLAGSVRRSKFTCSLEVFRSSFEVSPPAVFSHKAVKIIIQTSLTFHYIAHWSILVSSLLLPSHRGSTF